MDQIHICNLEVFCNHGVYPEENTLGQKFLVDAVLYTDTRQAGLSDELSDSVSYGEVGRFIVREMKKQNDKLIERVAERLAEGILKTYPVIRKVRLEVKKPWAPVMMHLDYASVTIERAWHRVYIGVGSNMGDRNAYIQFAKEQVQNLEGVGHMVMADVLETEPYGYTQQDCFLNTVFEIDTIYPPLELLQKLQEIEQEAHRERTIHWGPRTLDLDILLYDQEIIGETALAVPHPELHKRMFVLKPLCQLNPNGVHPLLRRRFSELMDALE